MQILNLVNLEKSDIKYTLSRFPDGEVQISLGEFSHKDQVCVKCRITNAEELFIVTQVLDILDRHDVYYDVDIFYLMGMRMDRVMDFNRPFTLKVIVKMLSNSNTENIAVLEPHSDVIHNYRLGNRFGDLYLEESTRPENWTTDYQLVLPDAGAVERYGYFREDFISCSKVRDLATGRILEIKVDNPEKLDRRPLMIVDDLCDGGGTFCGIAEALGKLGVPKEKLNISVVHMVNPKGIKNLSKNFNHVWITNSYKDWENLPENVTMLKVI